MKITDNQIALVLLGLLAGTVAVWPIPGPNGQMLSVLAGGLIGFLRQTPKDDAPTPQ